MAFFVRMNRPVRSADVLGFDQSANPSFETTTSARVSV